MGRWWNWSIEWWFGDEIKICKVLVSYSQVTRGYKCMQPDTPDNLMWPTPGIALLPHKSNDTYKKVFTAILNACENYNIIPYPTVVSCDFEQAIHKAILSTFGHVRIQGCFFHLTQSTWRRIQEEGLAGRYREDEDAKHFCGMLAGLAFLPPNQVIEGMAFLRTRIPDGFEGVVDYFDSNYVNGPLTATRLPGGRMRLARCTSPRYGIQVWNVYQATMDGTGRTNNVCESWNH